MLGEMGKKAGKTLQIKLCCFLILLICESSQLSFLFQEPDGLPLNSFLWSLLTLLELVLLLTSWVSEGRKRLGLLHSGLD